MKQTSNNTYFTKIKCPKCKSIHTILSIDEFFHFSWSGSYSYAWYERGKDGYKEIYRYNCPKCGYCIQEEDVKTIQVKYAPIV